MSHTLAAVLTAGTENAAEHSGTHGSGPAPIVFGIVAMVIFLALLAITFAFKHVGSTHD